MPGPERRYRKKALKPAIKRELVSYLTAQVSYKIIAFGGVDKYGYPVLIQDDTEKVIQERYEEEKKACTTDNVH